MAKVTCITMQRDEEMVLENWIKHHGYLFGFDRLIVLDNGSENTKVIETLRAYEACGTRVVRGPRSTHDFHEKGNIVCRIIRELEDHCDDSDFYVPIDCDEFLGLYESDTISIGRRAIHDYLDSLVNVRSALRINSSLYNVPGRPGWFCPRLYDKGLVARNTITGLDHGFHYPQTIYSDRVLVTNLVHLHFHNKPLDVLRANARTKLAGFVNPDDPVALENFNGAGVHLKKYFSWTEQDYANIYEGMLQIMIPEVCTQFAALGMTGEIFDMPRSVLGKKALIAQDGREDQRATPKTLVDMQFVGDKPLSRPDPLFAQYVRSRHTHV